MMIRGGRAPVPETATGRKMAPSLSSWAAIRCLSLSFRNSALGGALLTMTLLMVSSTIADAMTSQEQELQQQRNPVGQQQRQPLQQQEDRYDNVDVAGIVIYHAISHDNVE